ncbi:carboxylating nicotinate-nucleotide diphosphorylase [Desulfotalea psychrophila]|uniref:Probable nicotinate-nucleotide pyrophosphorylase [carboxylating] n=1 Tax=Desulfotalea psychrophila (strain LSv54 / DSM 12343) TaxID=177439 RepID=Q6AMA1_DESPS|nr:carboxylating nicotinate-nucleotide diphosphorylase [Desulfotalea psychrophila]CAG36524.1 probable nicotinate-nucleotide pyrophosphorylase [Desulfotalea psychrophila LSv54]
MDKNTLRSTLLNFLAEDIGRGDITSESIFPAKQQGKAHLVARQPMVVAGADAVAGEVFRVQNDSILVENAIADGTHIEKGDIILTVSGPVVDLLKAERVALNLLQRLSAIATMTSLFVQAVEGTGVRITDTRKTTPGLRMLEKYAVLAGGGSNHRFNLADGVMIKDNHIAACGSLTAAVERARLAIPHTIKIEVETDTLPQVEECVACGADIIMLDNMSLADMKTAVAMIDGRALVEASGGVTLKTVADIATTGVDIISSGALTHSVISCDIGMDWSMENL